MTSRRRVFLLLSILLFIIHFLLTTYCMTRMTTVLESGSPFEPYFAQTFAIAVTTFPLYSLLSAALPLLAISVINSAVIAMILAFVFVRRWRSIVAIVVGVPLLLWIAMTATSMLLERRIERGAT